MFGLAFFALAVGAYLTALFGPALPALWFWHQGGRHTRSWVAHLLYLPCTLLLAWRSGSLLFVAAHDDGDGDGPPGLGLALVPTLAMLIGSIVLYYLAVANCVAGVSLQRVRHRQIARTR